jgi:hypothetical protein
LALAKLDKKCGYLEASLIAGLGAARLIGGRRSRCRVGLMLVSISLSVDLAKPTAQNRHSSYRLESRRGHSNLAQSQQCRRVNSVGFNKYVELVDKALSERSPARIAGRVVGSHAESQLIDTFASGGKPYRAYELSFPAALGLSGWPGLRARNSSDAPENPGGGRAVGRRFKRFKI